MIFVNTRPGDVMADEVRSFDQARQEAAEWLTLLNSRTVSANSVTAFRTWRRDPVNAAAYSSVESIWKRAIRLADDPEARRVLIEAQQRKPTAKGGLSRPGGRGVAAATVAALAGLFVAASLHFIDGEKSYSTDVGEERTVQLSDGSKLQLDTDTSMTVRLFRRERRVQLTRGRALFDIARDPVRPFVVDAGQTEVRALGTKFAVRRDRDRVDIVLVEGSVRVERPKASGSRQWVLRPGQNLSLPQGIKTAPRVEVVDPKTATSWTSGRLVFSETPLEDAVAEVNRYSRNKVILDVEGLVRAPISGAIDSGDTEAFVSAVCELYALTPNRLADGTVRLGAAATTSTPHPQP